MPLENICKENPYRSPQGVMNDSYSLREIALEVCIPGYALFNKSKWDSAIASAQRSNVGEISSNPAEYISFEILKASLIVLGVGSYFLLQHTSF